MKEIPISTLAPKIVGADLSAPETIDTRDDVPRAALLRTVGRDLIVNDAREAEAYLRYLAANDGGDPTQISAGGWAHRTLFGAAQSARARGFTPRAECPPRAPKNARPTPGQLATHSYRAATRDLILTNASRHGSDAPKIDGRSPLNGARRDADGKLAVSRAFTEALIRAVNHDLQHERVSLVGVGRVPEGDSPACYATIHRRSSAPDEPLAFRGQMNGSTVEIRRSPDRRALLVDGEPTWVLTQQIGYQDDIGELPLVDPHTGRAVPP